VINSSAKQSYNSDQQFLVPNVAHTISLKDSSAKLTKQDYANLRVQGFDQLIAVAQTKQHIYTSPIKNKVPDQLTKKRIEFIGIDTYSLLSLPSLSNPIPLSQQINQEKKDKDANESIMSSLDLSQSSAILHPRLLEQLQTSNQGLIQNYVTQEGIPLPAFKSFDNSALGNNIIMDIAELYRLYTDVELSVLLVVGELSKTNRQILEKSLPNHLQLNDNNAGEQDTQLTSSFHLNLMAMALLMFVVCLFIVVNAVNLLLNSRLVWLKICRQLGISRRELFAIQLIEMVMLTFLSSLIGIVLGIELAKLASPAVQETLENLYAVEVSIK